MPQSAIIFKKHVLEQVNSTNLYAMEQLHAGLASHGEVFITPKQTQGKGQRGKEWVTAHGENLTLSLVTNPQLAYNLSAFRLSVITALASATLFENNGAFPVFIKWPNDLYIGDRKAGGILIETILSQGKMAWAVVGVGLNINQTHYPQAMRKTATSLCLTTGKTKIIEQAVDELLEAFEKHWVAFSAGKWPELLNAYNKKLFKQGEIVKLKKGNAIIPCRISRVSETGQLLAGQHEEWQFNHGEVEWLLN